MSLFIVAFNLVAQINCSERIASQFISVNECFLRGVNVKICTFVSYEEKRPEQIVAPLAWGRILISAWALESMGLYVKQVSLRNWDTPLRQRADEMKPEEWFPISRDSQYPRTDRFATFQTSCRALFSNWRRLKNDDSQKLPWISFYFLCEGNFVDT